MIRSRIKYRFLPVEVLQPAISVLPYHSFHKTLNNFMKLSTKYLMIRDKRYFMA